MHQEWKNYIENLPFEVEFLYKSNYLEFHKDLKPKEFPIAYKYDGNTYEILISQNEFDLCDDLNDLMDIMNQKVIQ